MVTLKAGPTGEREKEERGEGGKKDLREKKTTSTVGGKRSEERKKEGGEVERKTEKRTKGRQTAEGERVREGRGDIIKARTCSISTEKHCGNDRFLRIRRQPSAGPTHPDSQVQLGPEEQY